MDKNIFLIHEVAEQTGRHPNTIRNYERRGLIPPAKTNWCGWKLYTQEHIKKIRHLSGQDESN